MTTMNPEPEQADAGSENEILGAEVDSQGWE